MDAEWSVHKHAPIEKLEENLWTVEGSIPRMPIERRMTVVKREDGRLVIHSAICLGEEGMRELEAFGEPAYLVVPNHWHRYDAPRYVARYPEMKVYCPEGVRRKIERKVSVDGGIADFPGCKRASYTEIAGTGRREGVLVVRSGAGTTLVFNDLVFNVPDKPGSGLFIPRILGSLGEPKVTRIGKLLVVKDKEAVRGALDELAQTPELCRIIPGHGELIESDAVAVLRKIAAAL